MSPVTMFTTKTELMTSIHTTRAELETLLAQISDTEMLQPGFNSDWTGKDVLAHIIDWERRFLRWYFNGKIGNPVQRPEPCLTWEDVDRLNADMIAAQRPRPLSVIRAEFDTSHRQMLAAIAAMTDAEIFTVGAYAWTGDTTLQYSLRANTDIHYGEHIPQLQAWLAQHSA